MIKNKTVLNELKKIQKKRGLITPQYVLEEAYDENHPLHKAFDWDNNSAAEKHRLWQARQLIRSVEIEIVGKKTPAFWNAVVEVEGVKTQGYFSSGEVLDKKQLYEAVLKDAVKQVQGILSKYDTLKEIHKVIDKVELKKLKQRVSLAD